MFVICLSYVWVMFKIDSGYMNALDLFRRQPTTFFRSSQVEILVEYSQMYSQLDNDNIFIYLGKPYDRRTINAISWKGRQDYSGLCKAKLWIVRMKDGTEIHVKPHLLDGHVHYMLSQAIALRPNSRWDDDSD